MAVNPPLPEYIASEFHKGNGICAVATLLLNGDDWSLDSNLPCHGVLNRTGNIRAFATSIRPGEETSYHRAARFWRWLFRGDDSPYRPMSLSGEFVHHEQDICGYVWYEMGDWSKNYLMHLLMASRIPQEYSGRLTAWEKLQFEHGMTPLQAFYLIHYVSYIVNQEAWQMMQGEALHSPFHADYTASYRALKECKPRDEGFIKARSSGYYTAVNKLFVPPQHGDRVKPMIKALFEPKDKPKEDAYLGPFERAWEYEKTQHRAYRIRSIKELNLDAWDWEVVNEY